MSAFKDFVNTLKNRTYMRQSMGEDTLARPDKMFGHAPVIKSPSIKMPSVKQAPIPKVKVK